MSDGIDIASYKEVLLVLATAALVVPAFHRLKLSPIFGFMLMGTILGPDGLGRLASTIPWIGHITVPDRTQFDHVAELGIVFLLFMIGLELSLERLNTMRWMVFGMGAAKLSLAAVAVAIVVRFAGGEIQESIVIGLCLALSSTALVVQLLADKRRLGTTTGRSSFAILLFEDIAVVPILVVISVLGAASTGSLGSTTSLGSTLALAAFKAISAILSIILVGRYLLRPVFRRVAATKSPELFMAACLLVIVGTSLITAISGLSMALGAFLAGLLLAETEFRREIEVTIEPFKGLLLGVFFFAVGMSLDVGKVIAAPATVLISVFLLLLIKAAVTFPVLRLFRIPHAASLETALLLSSAGEFAFVVLGLAIELKVIGRDTGGFAVTVGSLSLALLPFIGPAARRLSMRNAPARPLPAEAEIAPDDHAGSKVIIAGFGRVGRLVASMLEEHGIPYLAVEADANAVALQRKTGKPVFYGNAARADFLSRCGIAEAVAVVVTMDNRVAVEEVAVAVRALRPDIVLVVRARDLAHARDLYNRGVTEAVPEAFEASLHLAEATLIGAGVPLGLVIATVHERRDQFRAEFQTIDRGDTRTQVARIRARQRAMKTKI